MPNLLLTTSGWKPGLTDSFRDASAELFGGSLNPVGGNLQNVPDRIRRLYVPTKPNYKLIQADQSGAEALIVAYLCRAGNYRDLFLHGVKCHVFVALQIFKEEWSKAEHYKETSNGIAPDIEGMSRCSISSLRSFPGWKAVDSLIKSSDTWPAAQRYYFIAKMISHSSNYGIRSSTLRMRILEKSEGQVVLSKDQADFYLEAYHAMFPEIREWHAEIDKELLETRTLRNLFGYPREFYGDVTSDDIKRKAYAWKNQSTVGCITNIALVMLQDMIERENLRWDVLNNCHDSLLIQTSAEESLYAARVLRDSLCIKMISPKDGTEFAMRSEVSIGDNWGKYKKGKNDGGMQEITLSE